LPFLDLLNEPAKLRVLERFQSLGDGQLLRQLSLLQSHEQRQIQRSSVLRVYSFSGMLIFRDDEAIDMKRKKPLLLLIYLLYRDRPVGDQTLLEHFWPGDENKGRTSLRSAMSYLRKLLSPDSPAEPFERQASGISVAKWVNVWFDYREFEQLVAQGQTHQGFNPQRAVECFRGAVKLCRGPFLENIYEDWALEVRERSEQLLESCLRFLGEQCLAAESWAEAYEHASRALRRDDLSQPFYEMAMKALIELGRHHDAITLFEQGKVRLHRELELEPSIEMMRLRQMAHLNV
jgi:two-component SAPR family response regulator